MSCEKIFSGCGLSKVETIAEDILARISSELQFKRMDMKMNQKEFAKYMGVSQGMISKWESGEYNFTIYTLTAICEKLDIDINNIIKKDCEKE